MKNLKYIFVSFFTLFNFYLFGQTQQEKQLDSVLVKYTGKNYQEFRSFFKSVDKKCDSIEQKWLKEGCPFLPLKRIYYSKDFPLIQIKKDTSSIAQTISFKIPLFKKINKVEVLDKSNRFINPLSIQWGGSLIIYVE